MEPIPAATLIPVREHAGRIETHLLLRGSGAAFMSGEYVFPGGRVDLPDHDIAFWERHADLSFNDIVSRFGGNFPEEDAVSYAVTAIRETLEEAGVFFADGASARKDETERICTLQFAENLAGEVPLSPPTLVTLREILPYITKTDRMEACQNRSWGKPLLPRLVPMDGGGVIL